MTYYDEMNKDHPAFDRKAELLTLLPIGERFAASAENLALDLYGSLHSIGMVDQLVKSAAFRYAGIRRKAAANGSFKVWIDGRHRHTMARIAEAYVQEVYGDQQ